jgi:putative oxidoreductase
VPWSLIGGYVKEQLAVIASGTIQNRLLDNRHAILALRLGLAGVFLVSSLGKLVDIEHYSVAAVYSFNILPAPLATAFGWAVPFIELACAAGLLFGVLTRLSALGTALMSASFFVAKLIVLSRGMDMACGCFGAVVSTMASSSIYLDPAIFFASMAVLFSSRQSLGWASLGRGLPEKWSDRPNLACGGCCGTTE